MRRKRRMLIVTVTAAVFVFFLSRNASCLPGSASTPAFRTIQNGGAHSLEGQIPVDTTETHSSTVKFDESTFLHGQNADNKTKKYDPAPFATHTYFGRSVRVADSGKAHVQQVLAEIQDGRIYDAALSAVSGQSGAEKTVIDIGGNFGAFSMAVKINAPSVRLFTFEAIPTNCANLQANMRGNALDADWTFSCEALGSDDGETLTFSVDVEHSGGGSSAYNKPKNHPSLLDGRHQFFNVASSKLDTILDRYDIKHIDALKIDCEGCEYAVLKSSRRIKEIDIIVAEFHINSHLRRQGHTFENLKGFLREQNPNIIIHSVDIHMHEAR